MRRLASGAGCKRFACRPAWIQRSIGFFLQSAGTSAVGGSAWRKGCSDHQSGPARFSAIGSGQSEPASIQARSVSFSAAFSGAPGGISSARTRWKSRLLPGSRGMSAGPRDPPRSAESRVASSRPPIRVAGPWQARQRFSSTAGPAGAAAPGEAARTSGTAQPRGRIEQDRATPWRIRISEGSARASRNPKPPQF